MGIIAYEPLDAATRMVILSLRILVVTDVSAEHVHGGAERMLSHHLRALVGAGHAVTILTRQPKKNAALVLNIESLGIAEHRLPFSGDKGYQGLKHLKAGAKSWWKEHKNDFDVVVSEQPFVMWSLLKAGCKLPRLQVCYSFAFEEYETRYGLNLTLKKKLVITGMKRLEKQVYGSAEHLLVLSQFTQDRFEAFFGIEANRVSVVPAAAETGDVALLGQRNVLREGLGWENPTVTTLRNLVPRTGVDLLIQTAAIVKAKGVAVRWVIMGDGALRESMQKLADELGVDDEVTFTGYLSEEDVQKRLVASDVFMVPTRGLEGFGLVTLEANACGTPVLATPIAANAELVPTIRHNQLAETASPLALAEKLIWMIEHPIGDEERHALQGDSQSLYSWEKHDRVFVENTVALVTRQS